MGVLLRGKWAGVPSQDRGRRDLHRQDDRLRRAWPGKQRGVPCPVAGPPTGAWGHRRPQRRPEDDGHGCLDTGGRAHQHRRRRGDPGRGVVVLHLHDRRGSNRCRAARGVLPRHPHPVAVGSAGRRRDSRAARGQDAGALPRSSAGCPVAPAGPTRTCWCSVTGGWATVCERPMPATHSPRRPVWVPASSHVNRPAVQPPGACTPGAVELHGVAVHPAAGTGERVRGSRCR